MKPLTAATKLGVPSPTPWEDLAPNNYANNGGANFGVGGAAVTYAYGFRPLDQQVDMFASLVNGGSWSADHLAQSVALVSLGVNDYTYYNQYGNGPGVISSQPSLNHHLTMNCWCCSMKCMRRLTITFSFALYRDSDLHWNFSQATWLHWKLWIQSLNHHLTMYCWCCNMTCRRK